MKTTEIIPKLTLIGAGPGDPDLITVKGARALADADVVLYDALVSRDLLNYAPARAMKIFVGKRAGRHHARQEEINEMIVQYARSHGHVVRLKGGDPFIFGRGMEEIRYASAHGIACHVVPGISSAQAVPALHNIPLTHRGTAGSFWVVTGCTRDGKFSRDLQCAARSSATVVILMGMKNLPGIVEEFKRAGKRDTPVAIIQSGSTPDEKVGIGTIYDIKKNVEEKGLSSPAAIVAGEVDRFAKEHELTAIFKEHSYVSI